MMQQILELLAQLQERERMVPTPNAFGAGGMMPMSPDALRAPMSQSMQMRPPMQQGPAPPVGGREIAAFLGGQANGRSITSR